MRTAAHLDNYARLPLELRNAPRWLLWTLEPHPDSDKKPRKIPLYASGGRRSGRLDGEADLARLETFEKALAAFRPGIHQGLGFALGPDGSGQFWQGIDLDDLEDHPGLTALADDLPGYVERSPSGRGVHALGYGGPFEALGADGRTGIEAYCRGRFFTVTGVDGRGGVGDLSAFVERRLAPLRGKSAPPQSAASADERRLERVAPGGLHAQLLAADLQSALAHIPADDRDHWVRIGLALKPLGSIGWDLWSEWSRTSEKFNLDDAVRVWNGLDPKQIDYRTVFVEACSHGWRNPGAGAGPPPAEDGVEAAAAAPEFTDEALALEFADRHHGTLRFVPAWGKWMVYGGGKWAPDETNVARDLSRALCREIALTSDRASTRLASLRTVKAVEELARVDRRLVASAEQWDKGFWRLNTPDGVVDLRTGAISPHRPEDHLTKMTSVAPDSDCPTWRRFLNRVTEEDLGLQQFLRRMSGYMLTGDTSAQALFFAYGTGANGKSVFIDTLAGILADYHRTAPIETFTASANERHPTELAMLRGARLVTANETEEGRRWAESKLKTLTGGDVVSARFMRQDFFEYKPQFKLLIAGNHKPGLRSVDQAMRRRLNLIPFTVFIPPEERDPHLKEKLRVEWPGILGWMIEGCLEWQRSGLQPPAMVREATEAYFEAEDAFGVWLDEGCRAEPGSWTRTSDLFGAWKLWAEVAGETPGSIKRFAQALEDRGYQPERRNYGRGFRGIRLRLASQCAA